MSLIFAVRWEPAGDRAFIDYMAVNDKNFEYEIKPVRLEIVTNDFSKFERTAKQFFKKHKNSKLEYKSVIRRFRKGKPRDDSTDFHNAIQQIISDCKIKKHARLRDDLKGDANNKFKSTLFNYKLVSQKSGKAWQHRLWAVALHITKGTVDRAIRKIIKIIK